MIILNLSDLFLVLPADCHISTAFIGCRLLACVERSTMQRRRLCTPSCGLTEVQLTLSCKLGRVGRKFAFQSQGRGVFAFESQVVDAKTTTSDAFIARSRRVNEVLSCIPDQTLSHEAA